MPTVITAAEVREGETVVSLRRVPRPPEDRWELRLGQRQLAVVEGWDAAVSTAERVAEDAEELRLEQEKKLTAALTGEPAAQPVTPEKPKGPVRKGL